MQKKEFSEGKNTGKIKKNVKKEGLSGYLGQSFVGG